MHPVCAQDVSLGQLHVPACPPKAIPIPASSRTIEPITSLFIYTTPFFMNISRPQQLISAIAYDDLDFGKRLLIFEQELA